MLIPSLRAAAVAAIATLLMLTLASSVRADGNLDQSLEGDPGCNTGNFAASVTAANGQRQSFVPTGSLLTAVSLCVSAAAPNTPLIVAIYMQGGALVGGGSTASNPIPDAAGPPVRYVHVDFLQPYTVTPGATYVIENLSGVPITWYGTAAGSPYSYCHGAPNTTAVGDYGFQTFLADGPAGSAACPAPPPTNTPVPAQPTNPPSGPTNTPAPGATTAPTNTPAPGSPAAAGTPATGSIPPSGGASAGSTNSGGGAGAGSGPSGLPASGSGGGDAESFAALAWQLLLIGTAMTTAGTVWRIRQRARRHP